MDTYGLVLIVLGIIVAAIAGNKPERVFWSRLGYFTLGCGVGFFGAALIAYQIVMGNINMMFLR